MTERVELWLRSMSSWTVGRAGTFVEDLEGLSGQGIVGAYEVNMWNDHVPTEGTSDLGEGEAEAAARERVEAVHEWADERGYELPAFTRSKTVRRFGGPSYEATVVPLAALLGFEDGELQWMAPYSDGDGHVSVQGRLDELAAQPLEAAGEGGTDVSTVEAE